MKINILLLISILFFMGCSSKKVPKISSIKVSSILVKDEKTGLMWKKDSPLQKYHYKTAPSICNQTVFDGYDDWRLPSIQELVSLLDYKILQYSYNNIVRNDLKDLKSLRVSILSSNLNNKERPISLNMTNGTSNRYSHNIYNTMCVRGKEKPIY